MTQLALLVLPSANRVYADATPQLLRAELEILVGAVLGDVVSDVRVEEIGGTPYVVLESAQPVADLAPVLANLSAAYALFAVEGDLLRPVPLQRLDRYDSDLVTIQKYPGKTNEQFTKLLLNVTLAGSAFAPEMLTRRLTVLDPLCGRGTTLNQALMYGWDALGVDLDVKDFEAYAMFVERWLKDRRLKHRIEHNGFVRRNRQVVARRLTATLAATKEDHKAGVVQRLDVVCADTVRMLDFLSTGCADLVVADLPYGVQHGSRTQARGLVRSPLDLLSDAAPVWVKALRPGGAVGISWNTHVARRDDAVQRLTDAGLVVVDDEPYLRLRHRVDSSITRDVVVARKP